MQDADGSSGMLPNQTGMPWQTWALILGVLATAAQLYLVWGFDFFPSVDGPAHTHLAYAMYEALRGDSFYGSLVEFNSRINPNMLTQGILVALMAIAPPLIAEKILLTLYFVSYACAAAYTLAGINRKSLCLLPLLMFCSISLPLAFGFYNFTFSTVVFLAWFGYWWRHRNVLSIGVILGHACFAAIAYATHIFAFIVTVAAIGTTGLAAILIQLHSDLNNRSPNPAGWHRTLLSHALPPLLGSIPELIACLYFLFGRFGSLTVEGAANLDINAHQRIQDFLAATSFAPYDNAEFMAAAIFAPIVVTAVLFLLYKSREVKNSIPFAACFAAFLVLYLMMPSQWIVRWMPPRFQPLVFVVLLLLLASLLPTSIKPSHWKMIGISGLMLVLLSLAMRIPVFTRLDSYYQELASTAPQIESNSTLVALRLHPPPVNLDVFIQAGSGIASLRHSIDLKNFQGQAEDHPIQFRSGIGAANALGGDAAIISLSPGIKLMAYEQQTGRPIDYVLVYGFREFAISQTGLNRLDEQLRENYRLVFVSKPRGFVHLYARNSDGRHATGQ